MTIANHGASSEQAPTPSVESLLTPETTTVSVDTRRVYGAAALHSPESEPPSHITAEDIRLYGEAKNLGAGFARTGAIIAAGHEGFVRYHETVAAGEAPGSFLTTLARQWEYSGIDYDPETEVIDIESLAQSVETGNFYVLFKSSQVNSLQLAKFLESKGRKIPHTPLNRDNDKLYEVAATSTERYGFLTEAIATARLNRYKGQYVSGSYKSQFDQTMQELKEDLEVISPTLPLSSLFSYFYLPPEAQKAREALTPEQKEEFYNVYKARPHRMAAVAARGWEQNREHTIPDGLLDIPEYNEQIKSDQCVAAVFRMIYEGITGKHVNEKDLAKAIETVYSEKLLDDTEYLKVFETESFQQRYGRVQSLQFSGVSLETIANITTKLKTKRPGSRIFAVVNLDSDTSPNTNVQHRTVLLGADTEVITHDPGRHPSAIPFRRTPKDEFYSNWAKTQNTGYLVVAA